MRRREFITVFGGAVAAWPLAARAQRERMRRIGVLMTAPETDSEGRARIGALHQGLLELGWSEGRNLKIDYRWTGAPSAKPGQPDSGLGHWRGCGHGKGGRGPHSGLPCWFFLVHLFLPLPAMISTNWPTDHWKGAYQRFPLTRKYVPLCDALFPSWLDSLLRSRRAWHLHQ
jgi:hypothetical protein